VNIGQSFTLAGSGVELKNSNLAGLNSIHNILILAAESASNPLSDPRWNISVCRDNLFDNLTITNDNIDGIVFTHFADFLPTDVSKNIVRNCTMTLTNGSVNQNIVCFTAFTSAPSFIFEDLSFEDNTSTVSGISSFHMLIVNLNRSLFDSNILTRPVGDAANRADPDMVILSTGQGPANGNFFSKNDYTGSQAAGIASGGFPGSVMLLFNANDSKVRDAGGYPSGGSATNYVFNFGSNNRIAGFPATTADVDNRGFGSLAKSRAMGKKMSPHLQAPLPF